MIFNSMKYIMPSLFTILKNLIPKIILIINIIIIFSIVSIIIHRDKFIPTFKNIIDINTKLETAKYNGKDVKICGEVYFSYLSFMVCYSNNDKHIIYSGNTALQKLADIIIGHQSKYFSLKGFHGYGIN